jgi:hypothetical protein
MEKLRYEIKFICHESSYVDLLNTLNYHPAGFRESYASRIVNNIYFDSFDYSAFSQNLSGASFRQKLRFRWYGNVSEALKAKNELKVRRNLYGYKIDEDVELDKDFAGIRVGDLHSFLRERSTRLPEYFDYFTEPMLCNRYKRVYFESFDNRVRATLDSNVEFQTGRSQRIKQFRKNAHTPAIAILELKANRNNLAELMQVAQKINLRRSRGSKYVIGLSAALGM